MVKNKMENGEFTEDDIVVDPDIEVDFNDNNCISAYLETWFDVDEKFGLNINDQEDTWLNMYATYNPIKNTLRVDCLIESDDSEESFIYEPTTKEAELIVGMITKKIREVCDMTPIEFLAYYGDSIPK